MTTKGLADIKIFTINLVFDMCGYSLTKTNVFPATQEMPILSFVL